MHTHERTHTTVWKVSGCTILALFPCLSSVRTAQVKLWGEGVYVCVVYGGVWGVIKGTTVCHRETLSPFHALQGHTHEHTHTHTQGDTACTWGNNLTLTSERTANHFCASSFAVFLSALGVYLCEKLYCGCFLDPYLGYTNLGTIRITRIWQCCSLK